MKVIRNGEEYILDAILNEDDVYIHPVLTHESRHYIQTPVSFVYFATNGGRNEFLLNYNHYDVEKITSLRTQIRAKETHICYKKKYLPWAENAMDADLLYWSNFWKSIPNESNPCLKFFHERDIENRLIPIFKIVEDIRLIRDKVCGIQPHASLKKYNNLITEFRRIEENGLFTDPTIFNSYWPSAKTDSGLIFTEYNVYTSTGRPSNHFGGVNFSALNSTNGCRRAFISRHTDGWMVEFDFESYHINLISKIIGYDYIENPYIDLAKHAFKTQQPTEEEIVEAKTLMFRQIYGGVMTEFLEVPFLNQLNLFLKRFDVLCKTNSCATFLHELPFKPTDKHIKTFNYLLQNLETELNGVLIGELNHYLEDKSSKLVLYNYDSFLFDYDPKDGKEVLREIKNILHSSGFNTRMKVGRNYHDMVIKTYKNS